MSVGLGFILLCTFFAGIWFLFQNIKKRLLPQNKPIDVIELTNYQVEEDTKEKRVDIRWPVSVVTIEGSMEGETKEISHSGAFIKCSEPLVPGNQFVLTIETPEKGPISLKSVVVWSNSNIPEEKVVTRGMSIRYIQYKKEDLELLKSALDEHFAKNRKIPLQSAAFYS